MICLIGESGSGKSTIEKELCRTLKWSKVVSYTTRPPRPNEVDGEDYHFVDYETFYNMEQQGLFAESVRFRDWFYGSTTQELKTNDVFVIEPVGLKKLLSKQEELGLSFTTFYICVDEATRMIRMLQRGDDVDETYRRLNNDRLTFKDLEYSRLIDYTIDGTQSIKSIVSQIEAALSYDTTRA